MSKCYKPRAMDMIAQNVLKGYDEKLVNGEPQEIPIEEIIELHYGMMLEYRELTKDCRIHGMTVFEDSIVPIYNSKDKRYDPLEVKAGTILIDKRLLSKNREKRLRFTLAHELSHYIMHSDHYKQCEEIASKSKFESDEKEEREADELGAALLMTYGRVKVALKRLDPTLSRDARVNKLSNLFCVSKQAMEIRMKKLGLY